MIVSSSIFSYIYIPYINERNNELRLMALISHASKVLLHVINTRLQAFLNPEIAIEQAGFVKGQGTREQILILRQIIEKSREFSISVSSTFARPSTP